MTLCLHRFDTLKACPNSPGNSPGRGLTKGGTGAASEDQ